MLFQLYLSQPGISSTQELSFCDASFLPYPGKKGPQRQRAMPTWLSFLHAEAFLLVPNVNLALKEALIGASQMTHCGIRASGSYEQQQQSIEWSNTKQ